MLELTLQIAALAVHLATRKPAPPAVGVADSILCVGDSWTHGMGCSDVSTRSFPAVLQELLRQRTDKPWQVVNGGQSGQNSRDVLLRLPSQLQATKPRYVLVLIGRNDFWTRPELVDGDTQFEDHEAYRFRWRLPRLLAWGSGALRREQPPTMSPRAARGPEWESRSILWPTAYPGEKAYGRQSVDFAKGRGIVWIDVEAEFAAKVGGERLRAMRSSDGHVNDEGYRLMAEYVADGLLQMPGFR